MSDAVICMCSAAVVVRGIEHIVGMESSLHLPPTNRWHCHCHQSPEKKGREIFHFISLTINCNCEIFALLFFAPQFFLRFFPSFLLFFHFFEILPHHNTSKFI
jgi:hypothetical protein